MNIWVLLFSQIGFLVCVSVLTYRIYKVQQEINRLKEDEENLNRWAGRIELQQREIALRLDSLYGRMITNVREVATVQAAQVAVAPKERKILEMPEFTRPERDPELLDG